MMTKKTGFFYKNLIEMAEYGGEVGGLLLEEYFV